MPPTVEHVSETSVVPSGPLLILSPHLDDAALSCGALLDRDEPITVCDVFTERPEPEQHTHWDRNCGFDGSHTAHEARWAEERDAFAGGPHTLAAVDLVDGQYVPGIRDESDARRITRALDTWLETVGHHATVVVPVGAGNPHGRASTLATRWRARRAGTFAFNNSPDHLFVRDAVLTHLRERTEVTLLLYEEYPYLFAMGGALVVRALAAWLDRDAIALSMPVDRAAKAERISAYQSQLSLLFRATSREAIERALPAHERYWELRVS